MKTLSYKQRLALQIYSSVNSPVDGVPHGTCFPYDFEAYVKCAAKCNGKRLVHHWN